MLLRSFPNKLCKDVPGEVGEGLVKAYRRLDVDEVSGQKRYPKGLDWTFLT